MTVETIVYWAARLDDIRSLMLWWCFLAYVGWLACMGYRLCDGAGEREVMRVEVLLGVAALALNLAFVLTPSREDWIRIHTIPTLKTEATK